MLKDIVEGRPLGQHRLFLRFEDGVQGEVDIAKMIDFTGILAPLADPTFFVTANNEFRVNTGTSCERINILCHGF